MIPKWPRYGPNKISLRRLGSTLARCEEMGWDLGTWARCEEMGWNLA